MKKVKKEVAPIPRLKTIVKAKVIDGQILIEYVPVGFITKLTNWDYRMMEYLRDNELIVFKKERNGEILYHLESCYQVYKAMKQFQSA